MFIMWIFVRCPHLMHVSCQTRMPYAIVSCIHKLITTDFTRSSSFRSVHCKRELLSTPHLRLKSRISNTGADSGEDSAVKADVLLTVWIRPVLELVCIGIGTVTLVTVTRCWWVVSARWLIESIAADWLIYTWYAQNREYTAYSSRTSRTIWPRFIILHWFRIRYTHLLGYGYGVYTCEDDLFHSILIRSSKSCV